MYYGIDITYIMIVVPALLLAMLAQHWVTSTAQKYSHVLTRKGITAEVCVDTMLDTAHLPRVEIRGIEGNLTDHFDPRDNSISLSRPVYGKSTITALGVAAHETGHAIQKATGYTPLIIRDKLVPVTNIASQFSMPLFIAGLIFNFRGLALTGVILFSVAAVFQLVTLPVEIDASRRAIKALGDTGILYPDELDGAKKVLTAAAFTYVASLGVTLAQIARLLILLPRSRDD